MIDWILEPLAYGLMYVVISAWRAIPLIVVVLLIDLSLRRKIAARFHCLLWSLVIVRLLCPVSVPSVLSVQGHFDQMGELMLGHAESLFEGGEPEFTPPPLEFDTFTFEDNGQTVTLPIIPPDATDEFRAEADAYVARLNAERQTDKYTVIESSELSGMQSVSEFQEVSDVPVGDPQSGIVWDWETIVAVCILAIWFSVASLMIIRSFAAHLRFAKRLRGVDTHTDAKLLDQLAIYCQRFDVRRVPAVKEVDGLSVPAVFGLWKPTICLPPGTAATLSANEMAWVLSHELAHIKRRDAWLLTIATLARSLHWFNPMMHLAFSRLRLYVEQSADDLVTRRLPDRSASEYGHVLLRYAAQQNRMPVAAVGLLFVSSNKSLRGRLEMLDCNAKRNRLPARVFAVAAITIVASAGLTDAKPPVFFEQDHDDQWQREQPVPLPESITPEVARGPMIEKTYDVKAVLEKLAEEEPRVDPELSLMSLFQIPNSLQPGLGHAPQIENGKLTITQTAESHRMTKLLLRSIERSGLNRQIVLTMRVLDSDPAIASAIDWTRRSIMAVRKESNEADSLNEFVTTLDPDAKDDFALQSNDASYRSRPMFAVKVSEQQLGLLMQRANQQRDTNMMMAPKITAFNGQVVSITDQKLQPFLTGIRTIEEENVVRDEPIIETVESGWRFTIYAEADGDESVVVRSVLTESELKGVEQADLPFLKAETSVQVPHVAKTSASASATLAKGESLVILSPHTYDPNDKPESPSARFYILTPRVIVQETEVEIASVPSGRQD